ncbi:Lrp/AsnC family transcriptional regulator, leucine-responsive regulatory protein [Staphylococcus auricularis]|uniref:Lrp/AsnC family transcriptional regulator n=1 Tax=Staphylococcus auricularis TaxID=29379 RepID=A0AAP8PMV3_9STAP|nr:Lrp/AsnC family transcriptional regulator [Staphylococcus auricularis]MBM0868417.1 Lrp/AsnC family transcriptional regulator [Staphylococcus auricularis]MCE5039207.1 Lrp/AsnC family transcriptional regulator [Staphylococcus auricularis]MCG7342164.1 Lrp/AsnC family transcriptional regulator [Staphylococcus auricularis]MEB6570375.1 Lrp/AsnC family transcriptional regulator [Staphylococcus auricularis]PNZ66299.1 Lrp/AsnC family transcriptional regulator [Staphylococcus auricularis]
MDLTDRKILKMLKQDSQISLQRISKVVSLSPPAVRERINKMKDVGIIGKYTIDIDYGALGYDINVIIEILIKNNLYSDFKLFISEQNDVEFCYRISGESCFIFKVHFQGMQPVEPFIDQLQYYGHTKTHFIFSKTV